MKSGATAMENDPNVAADQPIPEPKLTSWVWRLIRWLVWLSIGSIVFLGLVAWIVYRSAQSEPEFYKAALALGPSVGSEEGDEFEKRLLDLQNEARVNEAWRAEFTEDQINGWLATGFPKMFPDLLPPEVSDSRVGLVQNGLLIAFRFQSPRLKGIVNADVDVFCTEIPGQVAVKIRTVKSGFVPIPVTSIADRVTAMLRKARIGIAWTEMDGDPVALLDLPPDRMKLGERSIQFESIQLLENKLILTGRSTHD